MKNLSVAFFSHSPDSGGAERCLLDLIEPLVDDGIECAVILPKKEGALKELLTPGAEIFEASGIWWWVFGRHRWKSISRFFRSWRAIEKEVLPFLRKMDPDVIYSQTIVSPWGLYCAERLNKPHALGVSEFGKLDHNLEFIFGYEDSMRLLYENSQAVFWIADTVKDQFRPFLNPSSKSKVEDTIYSRIEIPSSMMPQAGYASRHQDHLFKIGIFGRIYEGKGQEDIAKAALEIKNRKIPAKIFLVGSPNHEYVNKIKRLMENDGTADMLEIVEYQENPYRMMSEMDVIVSCSKNEAMGRTLVEAALLEIPIIFPDRGGPAEIFKDNIHGLAYPPGYHLKLAENIASIYNDPAAARERVYRTKEYVVKKFSRESYSGKVKAGLMKVKESWGGRTGHGTFDFLFNNRSAAFDVLFLSKFYRLIYAITNSYR